MWVFGEKVEYLYFGIIAGLFVIYRHRPNIERLLKGQELKIKAGSAAPKEEEK
jgi:glycerol-3-phosphate acyltransferase PlsY